MCFGNVGLLLLEEEARGTFPQLFAKQGRGFFQLSQRLAVPQGQERA